MWADVQVQLIDTACAGSRRDFRRAWQTLVPFEEIEEGVAEVREVSRVLEEDTGSWHDLGPNSPR